MTKPALLNAFAARTPAAGGLSSFSGYFAEYDASDTSSITTSGSTVTAWNDISGGGNHLTSINGSPASGTRTINGLNVVDFPGSASCGRDIADQSQPLTVYVVYLSDITDTGGTVYEFLAYNGAAGGVNMFQEWGVWYAGGGGTIELLKSRDANAHIAYVVANGASSLVGISDYGEATGSLSHGLNKLWLGGRDNGSSSADGAIGHVVVYTAAHDSTTRAAVCAILKSKWGTP